MLVQHGSSLLDNIRQRQPEVTNDWAISTVRQLVAAEGEHLAQQFKPKQKQLVSEILKKFLMTGFLMEAELLAPSTCQVLRQIGFPQSPAGEKSKSRELIHIFCTMFSVLRSGSVQFFLLPNQATATATGPGPTHILSGPNRTE